MSYFTVSSEPFLSKILCSLSPHFSCMLSLKYPKFCFTSLSSTYFSSSSSLIRQFLQSFLSTHNFPSFISHLIFCFFWTSSSTCMNCPVLGHPISLFLVYVNSLYPSQYQFFLGGQTIARNLNSSLKPSFFIISSCFLNASQNFHIRCFDFAFVSHCQDVFWQ